MKRFENMRFTGKRFIVMLTLAFLGIATIGYAAITVNSFSPGQTISSSQVNANFSALASGMPAARIVTGSSLYVTGTTSSSPTNLISTTVVAPADGYFLVTGTATYIAIMNSETTKTYQATVGLSNYSTNTNLSTNYFFTYPGEYGTWHYFVPYTVYMQPVSKNGSYTYYLNAYRDTNTSGNVLTLYPKIVVQFFPGTAL